MATKTALKKVAQAVTGLGVAVSNTFAEQAHAITNAAREAFGNVNWEIDGAELDNVCETVRESAPWKGTGSEAARMSETRAIVKAYPFLATAADVFKREYGELRREHLVKVARICPTAETATDAGQLAVEFFEARDKNRGAGKGATSGDKLAAAMAQAINNCGDNASLKRSLYSLCKKHGINVK